MITCLLLSAGSSSRFGSPKALALLNEETVIKHLQKLLIATQVSEIIIVLGDNAQGIKPFLFKHNKIKVVYNKDYNLGQTSSFKCGLKYLDSNTTGILLLPVDYPLIKKETIDTLITAFNDKKPLALIPSYENKKGHPPIFSAVLKNEFLALKDSVGINDVFHHHPEGTTIFPTTDPGVLKTFNTKEEFGQIKTNLSNLL